MTSNGKSYLETEAELDAGVEFDPAATDMSLPDHEMLQVLEMTRKQFVVDYQKLITFARLNEKVDNGKLAEQQREQATKMVIQVHTLDLDIDVLKRKMAVSGG